MLYVCDNFRIFIGLKIKRMPSVGEGLWGPGGH